MSSFFSSFFVGNLLRSSSTKFVVVLFFIAFYTAPFSSKKNLKFFCLFVRSSTQLFFLVVLLLLLLRKTAFSFFSCTCDFFTLFFLSHLPPSSFLEWLSYEQFAELGSVQLLAFFSSGLFFGLPVFRGSVLSSLIYLVLLGGLF